MPSPVILFFLLASLVSCSSKEETLVVATGPVTESVYAAGVVKATGQYEVYPATGGIIEKVLVKAGDYVKKGDPLMVITHETASLNSENARLNAMYNSFSSSTGRLAQLQVAIETARLRKDNDSSLFQRQYYLWEKGIGSGNELDQRQLAAQNSRKAYEKAQLEYRELERQVRFTEKQSRRNADISTSMERDYIVKSACDGRVYNILKEKGEMASPQYPVATIGHAGDFELELQVDENDVVGLKPRQKVLITFESYRSQVFEGYIRSIDPIMNERSRSFKVLAGLVTSPPLLYPNLTLDANIILQQKRSALLVPRSWLIADSMVLLPHNRQKTVVTGLRDYQMVEIVSGLNAGDIIVKPSL